MAKNTPGGRALASIIAALQSDSIVNYSGFMIGLENRKISISTNAEV